jgi:hypothetical protein
MIPFSYAATSQIIVTFAPVAAADRDELLSYPDKPIDGR